jgi:hypothetical protein
MTYFKAMSRAFASSCKGTVWILTGNPANVMKQLPEYASTPSIWIEDEVDEMKALYASGVITKVIAIRFNQLMLGMTTSDVTGLVFGNRNARRTPEEEQKMVETIARQKRDAAEKAKAIMAGEVDIHASNESDKRDLFCTESYKQEDPSLDYFG